MMYQLEREMQDRLNSYRREADLIGAIPRRDLRRVVVATLRKIADDLEQRLPGPVVADGHTAVAGCGRKR